MSDDTNVEIAHKMAEPKPKRSQYRWEERLELVEVVLLAMVAVSTAWTGYESEKWDGEQLQRYGDSARDRFAADAASSFGGQQLVANSSLFTAWLQAKYASQPDLQRELERRFTPDYRAAFEAWLRTDPDNNSSSPPAPLDMPQFRNPSLEEAKRLNEQASVAFQAGTQARQVADGYVRVTVRLATVLFLVGIASRFKVRGIRLATDLLAVALLLYAFGAMFGRSPM